MQKANKISAFFFLGLFSLMMLHQAFPHLHHQHEEAHSHSNVAHSGEHHHQDDGSKENGDSPYGLFGFLMELHMHSLSSNEIAVFENNTIERHTKVEKDFSDNLFSVQNLFALDEGEIDKPLIYHPPTTYFNPYLSYLDLRGPPALG